MGEAKVADIPAGSACDEQRLSLGAGQMKELRRHRAECPAGHDDGALRAKWAAGTNGDGA